MATALINDMVYGPHRITEDLFVDLLKSHAVERMRGVHQSGASYLVGTGRDAARHDHLVGVMLLIRMLGGSVLEQTAGLLHDGSHTAFSHVADQVFRREGEDYHEEHFERLVLESDIPGILSSHGVDLDVVFNTSKWPLLEQSPPDLCADRVDYTLRDLVQLGRITPRYAQEFLASLTTCDGVIATKTVDAAIWFTHQYFIEVHDLFMNPLELYANEQLAAAIRTALGKGYLTPDHLFGTDEAVLHILHASDDQDVKQYLDRLQPGLEIVEDAGSTLRLHSKARIVDPLVVTSDRGAQRYSMFAPDVELLHAKVLERAASGVPVRVA